MSLEKTLADLGGCVIGRVLTARHHMEGGVEFQFDDVEALVSDGGQGVAGFFARRDSLKAGELCVIVNAGVMLDARQPRSLDCFISGFVPRKGKTVDGKDYTDIYAVTSLATALPLRLFPELAVFIRFDRSKARDVWDDPCAEPCATDTLLGRDVTEEIKAVFTRKESNQ